MRRAIAIAAAFAAFGASAVERVGDWWVNLPANVLKSMSESERTCAGRAARQFDAGSYRAAAEEWKRFQTEFLTTASEEAAAWASFFQALSLDKAKDRYKAIDLYSETLELYPESTASCAALYFRGRSYLDNGNTAKGYSDFRDIVENPDFNRHPLAYAAYNSLAWNALSEGKFSQALDYWRSLVALPHGANSQVWRNAKEKLDIVEALADPSGDLSKIASNEKKDFEARRKSLREWRERIWGAVVNDNAVVNAFYAKNLGKAKDVGEAKTEYLKKMSVAFSKVAGPVFAKCEGGSWEMLLIEYDTVAALSPKNAGKMVEKVSAAIRAEKSPERRGSRAARFIDRLVRDRKFADAKLFLDLIPNADARAWKAVDIGWKMRDGKYIVASLEPLEKSPDQEVVKKAKLNHANCSKQILGEWDVAIKTWEEYPSPPWTLWQIAECHRSAGRKAQAQGVLDEICGVFPADAAAAMLRKGDWYAADGDKKNAIACFRKILSHADWKKTGSASQAHQRLERYGIATGGAVLNEVH
ncbi:MAG: hypothetical protein J5807_01710 [Kiritimatiellae bacterium]|nr:hypothetical protein [Kiritimatiellia bacterium]